MFQYDADWSVPSTIDDSRSMTQAYVEAVHEAANELDYELDDAVVRLSEPEMMGEVLDDRPGGWFEEDETEVAYEAVEPFVSDHLYREVEEIDVTYTDGDHELSVQYQDGEFGLELHGTATDRITVEEHLGIDLDQVKQRNPMDHLTG